MDNVTSQKRSQIMKAVRSTESQIEVAFRKALWNSGYRYRKNAKNYFGRPDVVLKKYKTVIFIDSCYWHGCDKHCRIPSTRQDYWMEKINRNKKRDVEVSAHYMQKGWNIIRIWEHDLKELEIVLETTVKNLTTT